MPQGVDSKQRCKVCGGPIDQRVMYGICSRNPTCKILAKRVQGATQYAELTGYGQIKCKICQRPLRSSCKYGICLRNYLCRKAHDRERSKGRRKGKSPIPCKICGKLIRYTKYGICMSNPICNREAQRAAQDAYRTRLYGKQAGRCRICGGKLSRKSIHGICKRRLRCCSFLTIQQRTKKRMQFEFLAVQQFIAKNLMEASHVG